MKRIDLLALAVCCLPIVGCKDNKEVRQGEVFPAEDEIRAVDSFAAAQAASGAREDATLYRHHFDGGRLNSLGQSKLHLMTTGRPSDEAVIVYLDLSPKDPRLAERRRAVEIYFKDAGIAADRLTINDGPNPENVHPASSSLSRLAKTESGSTVNGNQESSQTSDVDTSGISK